MNYLNKYLFVSLILIAALFFGASSRPALAQSVPPLGAAQSFAALAGTTLTATGAGTVISGNVGVSPGLAVTGFPPAVVVNGQIYTGAGSLAGPAQDSALTAYNNLKGQACLPANNLTGKILGQTPGFLSLSPGVYCFDTSAQLNATLTLNDGGDPNAIFIFQIGTTLTTASSSQVLMSSGGRGNNVFWQIGSSATIGTSTTFRGHIIANTSITFTTSASTTGRVFALNGATTIDTVVLNAVPLALTTVQFSVAAATVAEAANSVTVTITRTGDLSGVTTVDYLTNDSNAINVRCDAVTGRATQRCDYETAVGGVTFAAGETTKDVVIYLWDDAHVEGPETFSVYLANAVGAGIGSQGTTDVNLTDNDLAPSPINPLDTSSYFVRMQYLDFLYREPETAGFDAWMGVLNKCSDVNTNPVCDRNIVSSSFFRSDEFQLKGYYVYRFYRVAFGRLPTYQEFMRDLRRVTGQTAAEVNAALPQYAVEYRNRADFRTRYDGNTNDQYVDALQTTVGVQVANSVQLKTDLNAGTKTRADVLREVVASTEVYNKEYNGGFVAVEYFGYLRRDPEEPGYTMWLTYLNNNPGDFRTMVNGFMNSIEYRLRFGTP